MPVVRTDAITGATVIVAAERAMRPDTFRRTGGPPLPSLVENCPFCPGHEAMTPPEVARVGAGPPDTPGWTVRIVPNLYPVVGGELDGAHEVAILSPAHNRSFSQLDAAAATDVLISLRDRAAFHLARGATHVQVFVNHGRPAGASIEHPHAQLVALPFVPPAVEAALARFAAAGRDLVTDEWEQVRGTPYEISGAAAVSNGGVALWCPPASTVPFEFVLAGVQAGPRFDLASDDELAAIADALGTALRRLHDLLDDAPYNVVVHTAPRGGDRPFHWHVRVMPRTAIVAGFELGTGVFVNAVPPEQAAPALRAATADLEDA